MIFNVQPYSVHDGPGIRTVIFLKGCPLSCAWCSNPESIYGGRQWLFREKNCRECEHSCLRSEVKAAVRRGSGAPHTLGIAGVGIELESDDFVIYNACPYHALNICGCQISAQRLTEIINNDRAYFGKDGGVTLSGGEPFHQPDFTLELLQRCRRLGISTAVESCLMTPFERIERALPWLNFFMFDIKLIDPEQHRYYCGADNRIITENIARLTETAHIPLLPRMPVIPSITDSKENIAGIAGFLTGLGLKNINLLPYMRLGEVKYEYIGAVYRMGGIPSATGADMAKAKKLFAQSGITCL